MNRGTAAAVAALLAAGACRPAPKEAPKSKYTAAQLGARFYMDLGADTIDVSAYPAKQREEYQLFAKTCWQCHTLARPINDEATGREEWDGYIRRMHANTQLYGAKTPFGKAEAAQILDFLAYDSKVRKLERKDEFAKTTAELKALFADVQTERDRLQVEQGKAEAREAPPYVGDRQRSAGK